MNFNESWVDILSEPAWRFIFGGTVVVLKRELAMIQAVNIKPSNFISQFSNVLAYIIAISLFYHDHPFNPTYQGIYVMDFPFAWYNLKKLHCLWKDIQKQISKKR